MHGKEVAELYVSAPGVKLDKPSIELKAFAKTKVLQPGESQELKFVLTPSDLASFNSANSTWVTEAGEYSVKFGNAQEVYASASFVVPKEIIGEKVNKVLVPKVAINELKRERVGVKKGS